MKEEKVPMVIGETVVVVVVVAVVVVVVVVAAAAAVVCQDLYNSCVMRFDLHNASHSTRYLPRPTIISLY
jgi:hypothetical protein